MFKITYHEANVTMFNKNTKKKLKYKDQGKNNVYFISL